MKPEKFKPESWVEQQVMAWAFQNKWSVDIFDSRAIVSGRKTKKNPGIIVGCSDLVGNDAFGLSVYVELKKEGEDGVCRFSQHKFLTRKIESNAFACVVGSVVRLKYLYDEWTSLRQTSFKKAREFLLKELPTRVLIDGRITRLN
jgi:hypothetical protein